MTDKRLLGAAVVTGLAVSGAGAADRLDHTLSMAQAEQLDILIGPDQAIDPILPYVRVEVEEVGIEYAQTLFGTGPINEEPTGEETTNEETSGEETKKDDKKKGEEAAITLDNGLKQPKAITLDNGIKQTEGITLDNGIKEPKAITLDNGIKQDSKVRVREDRPRQRRKRKRR